MIKYYSEASQDQFVDLCLEGQPSGFFVDIGAGTPENFYGSNTKVFEDRGWQGIVGDMEGSLISNRKCIKHTGCFGDGQNNTVKSDEILKLYNTPQIIDYLSIDTEGMDFIILKSILDDIFICKVITIEHNLYSMNPGVDHLKLNIFSYLSSKGYIRIIDNAGTKATLKNLHSGYPFEDWYINPTLVNYKKCLDKVKYHHENR